VTNVLPSAPLAPVHPFTRSRPSGQRGWAGILILLVVVLIIGFLAKDALLKYLGPAPTVQRAGPKTQIDPASSAATAPAPGNAIDRARGLEDFVRKESEKRGGDP
jgi:hypothetical protein